MCLPEHRKVKNVIYIAGAQESNSDGSWVNQRQNTPPTYAFGLDYHGSWPNRVQLFLNVIIYHCHQIQVEIRIEPHTIDKLLLYELTKRSQGTKAISCKINKSTIIYDTQKPPRRRALSNNTRQGHNINVKPRLHYA